MRERRANPLDFFKTSTKYVDDETAELRYSICDGCEFFLQITKQCRKCGCFMHLKTKIAHAECPINKWGPVLTD